MINEVLGQLEAEMKATAESLARDFSRIRTGRANPSLLDTIHVNYYGAETALNKLATVSAPEAQLIVVQPFDQGVINDIEKAIRVLDLGLSPMSDGKIIRVPIPDLTEERRRDLVKRVRKDAESHRVSARSHRREANDMLKELLSDKEITEDELRRAHDKIEELTRAAIVRIDEITKAKEEEVMSV